MPIADRACHVGSIRHTQVLRSSAGQWGIVQGTLEQYLARIARNLYTGLQSLIAVLVTNTMEES